MNKIHKLTMSELYLAVATFHTMIWWEMILSVLNGLNNNKNFRINKIMRCIHHKMMSHNRKIIHQIIKISKTITLTILLIHMIYNSNNKINKITILIIWKEISKSSKNLECNNQKT